MMRALLCHELGEISKLEVGETGRPVIGADQVRIGLKHQVSTSRTS